MFSIGFPELALILAIVLIVFGAGKLPNALAQLKKGLSEFQKGAQTPPAIEGTQNHAAPPQENESS